MSSTFRIGNSPKDKGYLQHYPGGTQQCHCTVAAGVNFKEVHLAVGAIILMDSKLGLTRGDTGRRLPTGHMLFSFPVEPDI